VLRGRRSEKKDKKGEKRKTITIASFLIERLMIIFKYIKMHKE
jgi:hypothetical protein